ncbi:MAG: hypothetical protein AAFP90_15110 [Planctomycetota bacterium]
MLLSNPSEIQTSNTATQTSENPNGCDRISQDCFANGESVQQRKQPITAKEVENLVMMLEDLTETVTRPAPESSDEIRVSDAEIARRVREIRASWTLQERVDRRARATERFEDLIGFLCEDLATSC